MAKYPNGMGHLALLPLVRLRVLISQDSV